MTSQALVQEKVWRGFAILAKQIGDAAHWYRPQASTSLGALDPTNLQGTLQVYIDTDPNLAEAKPQQWSKPVLYGAFDASLVLIGDYLVDPVWGTVFVSSLNPHRPVGLVQCNATVTISRPNDGAPGPANYAGMPSAYATVVTSWPASVLSKLGRGMADTELPGDVTLGQSEILLPLSLPSPPQVSDVVTKPSGLLDDNANPVLDRIVISAAEKTMLGWKLTCRDESP